MISKVSGVRFFVAWIAAFLVWFGGTYLVNGMMIDYSSMVPHFRPWDQELQRFPVLIIADLMFTASLVWFYVRLLQPKQWLTQGAFFGLRAAMFAVVPMYIRNYVAWPESATMLYQQIVYLGILMMVVGAVVGFMYRTGQRPV